MIKFFIQLPLQILLLLSQVHRAQRQLVGATSWCLALQVKDTQNNGP